jgi:preprotein translocase subunit SecF
MMQLISPDTRFDFVGRRYIAVLISTILNVIALAILFLHGPNLGIDFAGGSLVQVRFAQPTDADAVRESLHDVVGHVDIQDMGREGREYLIRVPQTNEEAAGITKKVTGTLEQKFGQGQVDVLRVESVGPRVGADLRARAVWAVLLSTLVMGVYIWLRFEWRYGIGAVIALLHDVIITVGMLIAFGYEFDLTIVAALLTVTGFSVNDTVIVSDRIRENRRKDRRAPLAEIINRSVNETLSRTILTTSTVMMVVLALYLLGGSVIHGFAFSLLVGFFVGTYSSVFIAAPVVLFFERAVPTAAAAPAARGGRRPAAATRRS